MSLTTAQGMDPIEGGCSNDADTVRQVLGGDSDAFSRIVGVYHARVFGFLQQMTRHRQDAEDLTQQTFLKAFQNLARLDVSRPLIHWLLKIARNNALNHFRSAKPFEPVPEHLPAVALSPDQSAETQDAQADLWEKARAVLPSRQFEILWLRYGEDFSVKETAQIVGLTQTHVKILVFRARNTLLKAAQ
jgi:RNA polymerase sigma-70 factor (ECF subfamily)